MFSKCPGTKALLRGIYQGIIEQHLDERSPMDPFLESFYPTLKIVMSFVVADLHLALDLDYT
jgi:hypothetical protein